MCGDMCVAPGGDLRIDLPTTGRGSVVPTLHCCVSRPSPEPEYRGARAASPRTLARDAYERVLTRQVPIHRKGRMPSHCPGLVPAVRAGRVNRLASSVPEPQSRTPGRGWMCPRRVPMMDRQRRDVTGQIHRRNARLQRDRDGAGGVARHDERAVTDTGPGITPGPRVAQVVECLSD